MAEDSRFAKCNIKVPRTKTKDEAQDVYPTNSVHHLKTKPGHEEEYKRYNKLKTESDEKKKESSTGDGTQLRHVSLEDTVELHKV